jgi:hypothetical protein
MMKKLILTCLITVCMSNMLGMEQSSTDSLSSLPKDFMEELPIDYLSALPKEIKKIVILDLGTVKGIRSLLETNKENAKLCNDPLILSHLLSLIFKMDDTTREDIRLFLEAHKDNGILLNDPMIIGFLTTKIAEPYAREAHNKKISEGFAPDFGDPFFDEIHSDRYLNRFSVPAKLSSKDLIKDALKQKHVELIGDKNAYVGDALRWRSHE